MTPSIEKELRRDSVREIEAELNRRMNPPKDRYWQGFVAGASALALFGFIVLGNLYLMTVGV